MFTIGIRREQAQGIAVDVLKDFRRELVLDAHPDDEKLIAALTLVIYAITPPDDKQTTNDWWSSRQHYAMRIEVYSHLSAGMV